MSTTKYEFKKQDFTNPKTKIPIEDYFVETTNNEVLFIGDYMEIDVPIVNFERKLASLKGKELLIFGLLKINIMNNETDKKILYTTHYKFPGFIITIPNSIYKETKMNEEGIEEQYIILLYKKNDIFIKSTKIPKAVRNAKTMINALFEGFIPPYIKYEDYIDLILNNSEIGDINYGVCAAAWSALVSELFRSSKNELVPLRKIINKKGLKEITSDDYKVYKLSYLPFIKSTFTALAFQDIEYAITRSIKRERYGEEEEKSKVEDVIKY